MDDETTPERRVLAQVRYAATVLRTSGLPQVHNARGTAGIAWHLAGPEPLVELRAQLLAVPYQRSSALLVSGLSTPILYSLRTKK